MTKVYEIKNIQIENKKVNGIGAKYALLLFYKIENIIKYMLIN
jgi:hypothetical protein